MPPTLRSETVILADMVATMLSTPTSPTTDITRGSVLRTLLESHSAAMAELYYALFQFYQATFIGLGQFGATGDDLDTRGEDFGLARDAGQTASGPVRYTRAPTYVEDIVLPAPQTLTVVSDTAVRHYRTLVDAALLPQGRSVSDVAPAQTLVSGVNDHLAIKLDGDAVRTLTLGSQFTGAGIASAIQVGVRALLALNPLYQLAYTDFRCDWSVTNTGRYTLRSGSAGPTSAVLITPASSNDASAVLKLGASQGGMESQGVDSVQTSVVCDEVGVRGNLGAGQLQTAQTPIAGIENITNPLILANGRDPASDDAYRQDLRAYLLALGRGTEEALVQAALHTVLPDGHEYVDSVQFSSNGSEIRLFVTDGQSLTVGAQGDVLEAVQKEISGQGSDPGGWLPSGTRGTAVPATLDSVTVAVEVILSGNTDLLLAQAAIQQALTTSITLLPVGAVWRFYADALQSVLNAIPGVLQVLFTAPNVFAANPPDDVPCLLGHKLVPGPIQVLVRHE